jgi:hypothetical protein
VGTDRTVTIVMLLQRQGDAKVTLWIPLLHDATQQVAHRLSLRSTASGVARSASNCGLDKVWHSLASPRRMLAHELAVIAQYFESSVRCLSFSCSHS